MKKHIPNFITLINLFAGCLALIYMFDGNYYGMFVCVVIAEFADLMDGFMARLLKVSSPIGKDLDSLADMVTFALLPGVGLYQLFLMADVAQPWAYLGFLITLSGCLRLAKYNVDTRKDDNFFGLATPSTAAFVFGLLLIVDNESLGLQNFILQPAVLIAVTLFFSWIMHSPYPMFNLRFTSRKWLGNEIRYVFILVSLAMIFVLKWAVFAFIVLFYILISILFFGKKEKV